MELQRQRSSPPPMINGGLGGEQLGIVGRSPSSNATTEVLGNGSMSVPAIGSPPTKSTTVTPVMAAAATAAATDDVNLPFEFPRHPSANSSASVSPSKGQPQVESPSAETSPSKPRDLIWSSATAIRMGKGGKRPSAAQPSVASPSSLSAVPITESEEGGSATTVEPSDAALAQDPSELQQPPPLPTHPALRFSSEPQRSTMPVEQLPSSAANTAALAEGVVRRCESSAVDSFQGSVSVSTVGSPRRSVVEASEVATHSSGDGGGVGDSDYARRSSSHVFGSASESSALAARDVNYGSGAGANRQKKNWRYTKEKVVGAGADGKVFKALDVKLNEAFALKEILIAEGNVRGKSEDDKKIDLMRKQIEALKKLPSHPNVVQHKGTERTTCALNVMMEYVPGGSISALLSKLGSFSEKVIRSYTRHICAGINFLHKNGVIHRDIKGANCLIGLDGTAKLADFGSCVILPSSTISKETIGEWKGLHGTSMWMSPECIQSVDEVTPKGDVWSLGCTVVEMATGKPPWHEGGFTNEWAAMFYIVQCGRGPPIPSHLSRQGHAFLNRCFTIDPNKRPTAEELLQDPFLVEEFAPGSGNKEMRPPSPQELEAPHMFPNAMASAGNAVRESPSTYATSNYSTLSYAVYDAEWGDLEAAEQEFPHPPDDNEEEGMIVSDQPLLQPAVALPSINKHHHSSNLDSIRSLASSHTDPTQRESSHGSPLADVSQEVISSFLMSQTGETCVAQKPVVETQVETVETEALLEQPRSRQLAFESDECGFGLPEPVLFNIFHYLEATDLCRVGAVSRALYEMTTFGAKEVLWRHLFVKVFGEIDYVRMKLRKNWKQYYQKSAEKQGMCINDRFVVHRQLCQSVMVFQGQDLLTKEPVAIKFEPWGEGKKAPLHHRPPSPARGVSPLLKTPTKGRTPTKAHTGQLPSSCTSPQREHPPTPLVGRPPLARTPISGLPRVPSGSLSTHLPSLPTPPSLPSMGPGKTSLPPRLQSGGSKDSRGRLPPTAMGLRRQGSSHDVAPLGNIFEGMVTTTTGPTLGSARPGQPPVQFHFYHQNILNLEDGSTTTNIVGTSPSSSNAVADGSFGSSSFGGPGTPTKQTNALGRPAVVNVESLYMYTRESAPVTSHRPQRSLLQNQHKILRHLEGSPCVPRVLHLGEDVEGHNVLVTELLGPSLNELLHYCHNQLSMRTVAQLALRLLDALKTMHEQLVVHGGLTPTNVVVGTESNEKNLFFVNFSQSRYFRDLRTNRPTTTSTTSVSVEKARNQEFITFCSTYIQRGYTAAPRDDLIAVGYVLCYLVHGGLPWIGQKTLNDAAVIAAKHKYLDTLARTPPIQLHYLLKSGYALRQAEVPDYSYLTSLVTKMMNERGWAVDDPYDWEE